METNQHRHFILFKPYGYLSQFVNNQTKRTKKKLLGELHDFPERLSAFVQRLRCVGRVGGPCCIATTSLNAPLRRQVHAS